MRVQRMIFHAVAAAALGAVCLAQGGMGSMGGPDQRDMGRQRPQNMGQRLGMPADSDDSPDRIFMKKAAEGGIAEVTMGNLAKQNGASDAVKQFGNMMVTDHSQANEQLRQMAKKKGITLPAAATGRDKKISKMLESKQGADFDKAYIHDMVKDHEADVSEFRKEATGGEDPEVKAWAQKTLPILEQHLAHAKEVAGQVGGDTAKKTAGAMSSQP
jgi:putative membrane protein